MLQFIVTVAALFATAVLLFFKWKYNYWNRKNVYTFPPEVPFGSAKRLILGKECVGELAARQYRELKFKNLRYGGSFAFTRPAFVVADINLIRTILTTDFQYFTDRDSFINEKADPLSGHLFSLKGAKWRALRIKLTPLFTSGKLKMMFNTLVDCTKGLNELVEKYAAQKHPFDIKEVFARYTTDIIASVGFGIECNCLKDPDAEFRRYGKKIFTSNFFKRLKELAFICSPTLFKFLELTLIDKDVAKFLTNIVNETIEYREKNKVERKDFMQLLISLRNTALKLESNQEEEKGRITYYKDGLSVNEIAAQAFVFFAAGYETSSTTLNFLIYELSQNPEVQEKLRKDIDSVLEKHCGQITYEAIQEMKYLDNCVNEALRKYPPVPILPRECTKDYKVPDSDLVIEKGTSTTIAVYGIHHDPEFYPDPEKFDPDRFLDENKEKRPPMTFIPFGEGPRICIGLRLGVLQTKVGLIEMLRRYRFTLNSKTKSPLQYEPLDFILTVKGGVWVDAHKV